MDTVLCRHLRCFGFMSSFPRSGSSGTPNLHSRALQMASGTGRLIWIHRRSDAGAPGGVGLQGPQVDSATVTGGPGVSSHGT